MTEFGLNQVRSGGAMKYSSRDKQTQETLALLKILALGNRQIEAGRVVPAAEAMRRARRKAKRR